MAHIIAKRALRLKDGDDLHEVCVGPHPQEIPDGFTKDPIYQMAIEDGSIVKHGVKVEPGEVAVIQLPPERLDPNPADIPLSAPDGKLDSNRDHKLDPKPEDAKQAAEKPDFARPETADMASKPDFVKHAHDRHDKHDEHKAKK